MTKIDVACPQTRTNIMHVFHSDILRKRVRLISHKLQGLPANKIFPIKNYEWETEMSVNVNNLSLMALRQMLHFAQDYVDDRIDYLRETGGLNRLSMRQVMCLFLMVFVVVVFVLYWTDELHWLTHLLESFKSDEEETEDDYYS
ncbi:predicted protein [Nematostella vectensis]|uniref:Uncharacterized protein n=1 Tax=Nematostella vectensis TaxID=45351 RepID=A7RLH5_NEMVE|nr:predicted protein [Nematostella vectensis]|eukprot:XP_001639670.1 predicted protein [Nematostella vectensis]